MIPLPCLVEVLAEDVGEDDLARVVGLGIGDDPQIGAVLEPLDVGLLSGEGLADPAPGQKQPDDGEAQVELVDLVGDQLRDLELVPVFAGPASARVDVDGWGHDLETDRGSSRLISSATFLAKRVGVATTRTRNASPSTTVKAG